MNDIIKSKEVKKVKEREVSKISSKGQVTVPKSIRDLLNLTEGDRIAFIEENGKVIITKASLTALRKLQEAISQEADEKGITEEYLLNDLEIVREEMWSEQKK